MCDSCGCPQTTETASSHHHYHGHEHSPAPNENTGRGRTLQVARDLLETNNLLALDNRKYLASKNILALNLLSSPGSGKTTMLEKIIPALNDMPIAVIEGDQQTRRDAERIEATGAPAIQINTGAGCHLDAGMIQRAVKQFDLRHNSLLFIENVGNLVCPALFDLGEHHKVVIISVTEGDDKPRKYPNMFQAADVCLINKTDLLPYVDFDTARCKEYARRINSKLVFFEISATTGAGLKPWLDWLRRRLAEECANV